MALDLPFTESLVVRGGGEASLTASATGRGRVVQRYGDRVELWLSDSPGDEAPAAPALDSAAFDDLTLTEQLGVQALRLRQSPAFRQAKAARPRQGEVWDMAGGCVEPQGPALTAGRAGAAAGTSDFLEGSVAVGVVIVSGPTADLQFSPAEREKVVAEVQAGLSYLAGINGAAGVVFSYDIRVVTVDVEADPNAADLEALWRDPALTHLGATSTGEYVEQLRTGLGTRWAYGAFFTKYPVWHFAYANSERVVMHYDNDGWGPDNIDRVFAHETGHIFGCPDEYAASDCTCGGAHGRFGDPNANCENCAPGGGIACIMKANDWAMCRWTYRHLGWMSPLRTADRGWLGVVSSPADRLDVFAVDTDRMIRTAFWQPGMPEWFQGWVDVLGGQAAPGAPVTAVSRRPGQLDIFVAGNDGGVWTAARAPGGGWAGWWRIGDLVVPQGAYIGAVSRSLDQLDIFATDVHGRTMTAAWNPSNGDTWAGWWELNGGRAAPGAPITAVSRRADHLDVFVTGTDGSVWTAAWTPANTDWWHGWWRIGDLVVPQGGYIGAVSRSTDQLDVFATDNAGRTMTAAWNPSNGDTWAGWWELNGGRAAPGSPIIPVSRSTDQLDVFVTGTDGKVYTAAWSPTNTDWWAGWWALNGGQSVPCTPVTAVSRSTDRLDAFVVGTDDRPWTAAWAPDHTDWWHGWWAMGP